jgi:hypothetical protein
MALPFQMKAAVTKTVEKELLQGVFVFEPSTGVIEVGTSLTVQAQFVPPTARDTPYQQVHTFMLSHYLDDHMYTQFRFASNC